MDFMVRDRNIGEPAALLNTMSKLDKQAAIMFPKRPMVDRVWMLVKQIRAKQAIGEALNAEFNS
jgi:hypothetical protein